MSELRQAILEAVDEGRALIRRVSRLRYHLRKRGLGLFEQRNGYVVVDRATRSCEFGPTSIDRIEAWLGEGRK